MTTIDDDKLDRLGSLVDRLEALGLSGPDAAAPRAATNPDGSPGNVVSGELIEAAWGNAVSNEFQRPRAWYAQTDLGSGPYGSTPQDFGQLGLTLQFHGARVYKVSAYISWMTRTLDGFATMDLVFGPNFVLNSAKFMGTDNQGWSFYTSAMLTAQDGAFDVRVQLSAQAGTVSVMGAPSYPNHLSYVLVEEVSMNRAVT